VSQTFAEKALARASNQSVCTAGQVVDAHPDIVLSHDNTAAIAAIFKEIGLQQVANPDQLAITLDHAVPAPTPQHARNHAEVRAFVEQQGVRRFYDAGRGICHQVLSEEAIILPGQLILGADSHTTHFGWMGAFGAGIGRTETAALWATGELWLRVPESLQVIVQGALGRGVTAKDLCLHLIGQYGADGGLYRSVEVSGPGIDALSLASRMVIPNMLAEFGVKNAYLPPDQAVFDYLAPRALRSRRALGVSLDIQTMEEAAAHLRAAALYPDPDASYETRIHLDAAAIEPMIACPHQVDATQPLSAVRGIRVHQAFIGTCTNGRLEDLEAAAEIVRGRQVARGTRLLVIPASAEVLAEGIRSGAVSALLAAGAMLGTPGCGPCMGNHLGILAPGEVCISTANRNFRGRMGQPEAEIYLASPAVVAASALAGVIADPREVAG
jgi:3-isopropylmalate/(R)-2-methylmalate dehydratase large subunit